MLFSLSHRCLADGRPVVAAARLTRLEPWRHGRQASTSSRIAAVVWSGPRPSSRRRRRQVARSVTAVSWGNISSCHRSGARRGLLEAVHRSKSNSDARLQGRTISNVARRQRRTDPVTRRSRAISLISSPRANRPAASIRSRSRRCWSAGVYPPRRTYRMPRSYARVRPA